MKILSLYFFIYSVAISCNTKSYLSHSPDENESDKIQLKNKESITWGSGGGFTNQVVNYSLDTNGVVLRKINNSDFEAFTQFDPSLTATLFESAETIPMNLKNINKPGNMYSFLYLNIKGKKRQFTWGYSGVQIDSTITNLFQQLNKSVQSPGDK